MFPPVMHFFVCCVLIHFSKHVFTLTVEPSGRSLERPKRRNKTQTLVAHDMLNSTTKFYQKEKRYNSSRLKTQKCSCEGDLILAYESFLRDLKVSFYNFYKKNNPR